LSNKAEDQEYERQRALQEAAVGSFDELTRIADALDRIASAAETIANAVQRLGYSRPF
jgi:hypothetical protein